MSRIVRFALRWFYLLAVVCCLSYLAAHLIQHSPWYQQHLYRQLVEGDGTERLEAAGALAQLGCEEYLLEALKCENPNVRTVARRALEHLWFTAAGDEAYHLTMTAYQEANQENHQTALAILNRLVEKFPGYAEGWNRRASVYWEMGQYDKSMTDCERTLKLNPQHYGAWQGIGICKLQAGDIAGACEALRQALRINPYDEPTRQSLRRCEELLRIYPHPSKMEKRFDLI